PNSQFINLVRGARGTVAGTYAADTEIDAAIMIEDDALTMALKIMLSGWQGPFLTDIPIQGFVITNDPIIGNQPNGIVLPVGVDAVRDYGIAQGDYLTITGSANPGNNVTVVANSFL